MLDCSGFLAGMSALFVGCKLYDARFDLLRGRHIGIWEYLGFLANPFVMVRRRLASEPQPTPRADLLRLMLGVFGLVVGILVGRWIFRVDWPGKPLSRGACGEDDRHLRADTLGALGRGVRLAVVGGASEGLHGQTLPGPDSGGFLEAL